MALVGFCFLAQDRCAEIFSPRHFLAVADPGEGPGGPRAPLFLDQTEARGAEKKVF